MKLIFYRKKGQPIFRAIKHFFLALAFAAAFFAALFLYPQPISLITSALPKATVLPEASLPQNVSAAVDEPLHAEKSELSPTAALLEKKQEPLADVPLSEALQRYTIGLCAETGVPYPLVLGIIDHESGFDENAVHRNANGTLDSGLMQINDAAKSWAKDTCGVTDLLDPKQNLLTGVTLLSGYLEKYSLHDSVMAYALGEAGMKNAIAAGQTSTQATDEIIALAERYGLSP